MARPGTADTRNFMSYEPSAEFAGLLGRSQKLRDFADLRATMRQIHVEFRKDMPFIPLWHLDTHVLASSRLKTEPAVPLLDPLAPFGFIEHWTLR
jgi:ABC-type oligopeptide transport system substrate-binding subunit